MRISDWSSDVCSSDLTIADAQPRLEQLREEDGVRQDALRDAEAALADWQQRKGEPPAIGNAQRVGFQWRGGPLGMCAAGSRLAQHQIGMRQCRETVWQDVYITVCHG